MYSFLVLASMNPADRPALSRAAAIVPRLLPDLGVETRVDETELPEIGGGWVIVLPRTAPAEPLIETWVERNVALLFFGALQGVPFGRRARRLAEVWRSDGTDGVRASEGDFSVVVVDRVRSEVQLASDGIGRRCIHHASPGSALVVASHDLPLVASGLVRAEVDRASAASVLAFDFSLDARSVLEGARLGRSDEVVRWRAGRTTTEHRPPVCFEDRLDSRDQRGLDALTESMLDVMRQRATAVAGSNEILVDITAGIDSRASLAVASSCLDRGQITAYTTGEPGSLDSRVGRRVARAAGVRHLQGAIGESVADGFDANVEVLACFASGVVTATNAVGVRRRHNADAPLRLRGGGGEIFHGRYYPSRSNSRLARLTPTEAVRIFLRAFQRHRRLPWRDAEPSREVETRARAVAERWSLPGVAPVDLLDAFYYYERFVRWSLAGRSLVNLRSHYLYESPALWRRAWRLPAPIALSTDVLERAVRSGIPRAWWIPVNGQKWLPTERRAPWLRKHSRRLVAWHARLGARTAAGARDPEALRRDGFSEILELGARDVIESASSIAADLLEPDAPRAMVEAHLGGARNQGHALGLMLTLERWREQLLEAARLARAAGHG